MIDYLERLLEEGKDQEALTLAEEMISNRNNTPHEVLAIQCALLRSRQRLGLTEKALAAGKAALELSRQLGEMDYHGITCLFLGVAYGETCQYQLAIDILEQYVRNLGKYTTASVHEAWVWYNLGLFYSAIGHHQKALTSFLHALEAADRLRIDRLAHGIRQAVAGQLIKSSECGTVPELLSKCSTYLRRHPDDPYWLKSRLSHLELRVRFLILSNRWHRADSVALRGLEESSASPRHTFAFHMLLAEIARDRGKEGDAVLHAFSAWLSARHGSLHDLEPEVLSFLAANCPGP